MFICEFPSIFCNKNRSLPCKIIVDEEGDVFPDWKEKLDRELDSTFESYNT
jgi:hypothetical protein